MESLNLSPSIAKLNNSSVQSGDKCCWNFDSPVEIGHILYTCENPFFGNSFKYGIETSSGLCLGLIEE
jgi:hypothetical protein